MVQLNSRELDWHTFAAARDDLQSNGWVEILDNNLQFGNEGPFDDYKLYSKDVSFSW